MSDTLQKVFRLDIPDSQTIIAIPASNRDQMGGCIETCNWLQRLADEGWHWQGQITRHWYADGGDRYEYLDVFRRMA